MLVLGIDTSSSLVTVGLSASTTESHAVTPDGSKTLVSKERAGLCIATLAPNQHGEQLAPLIEELLEARDVVVGDLGAIAVGLGPGPFTGLRVGIVTAKAMGDVLGIPVYGLCSLDSMARPHMSRSEPLAVITDARRKQVYWRRYDENGAPLGPPDLDRPADLAARLQGSVRKLVGAGAVMYADEFADFTILEGRTARGADLAYPDVSLLAQMVLDRIEAGEAPGDLTPLYLRRPDAQAPGRPKAVTPS